MIQGFSSSGLRASQVIAAGIAALVLTVGLSRFAYTPMLPVMQAQLGLSGTVGGLMATFNYAGYLTAALLATLVSRPQHRYILYRAGLLAGLLGTLGMGLTTSPPLWYLLRFIAGLGAAAGMLLGAGIVLGWLMAQNRRPQLGMHFIGMGLGIVLSGLFVMVSAPFMDWSQQWIGMGGVGLVLLVPAWCWMPCPPATPPRTATDTAPAASGLALLAAAYFCAGVGYVVSATFLVVVTESHPQLRGTGALVWIIAGVAATPATLVWDSILRRFGDFQALLAAYALQILSLLLSMLPAFWAQIGGAVLFGATFIGIVSMTLAMAGRLNPDNPSRAMAQMTLAYGVAQVGAPFVTGVLADHGAGYIAGLWMAAILMVIGMMFLLGFRHAKNRAGRF